MGVTTKDTKYFGQIHDTTTSAAARETHRLTHFPQSWSFLSLSFTPKKSNDDDGGGVVGDGIRTNMLIEIRQFLFLDCVADSWVIILKLVIL